jgi:hypothetical protein
MNKFYRLLSVVTLALSVALWSCKGDQGPQGPAGPQGAQGPTGAQGPQGATGATGAVGATGATGATGAAGTNGTNGKDGNANVKWAEATVAAADWRTVDAAGTGTGNTGQVGAVEKIDANISASSIVMAYVKIGTQWVSLPRVVVKETDGSTEQVGFGFETGKITFYYSLKAAGGTMSFKPQTSLVFGYSTIEKTLLANMKAAGVNLRSREAVNAYLQTHR